MGQCSHDFSAMKTSAQQHFEETQRRKDALTHMDIFLHMCSVLGLWTHKTDQKAYGTAYAKFHF
jgi:hypothetical protein